MCSLFILRLIRSQQSRAQQTTQREFQTRPPFSKPKTRSVSTDGFSCLSSLSTASHVLLQSPAKKSYVLANKARRAKRLTHPQNTRTDVAEAGLEIKGQVLMSSLREDISKLWLEFSGGGVVIMYRLMLTCTATNFSEHLIVAAVPMKPSMNACMHEDISTR